MSLKGKLRGRKILTLNLSESVREVAGSHLFTARVGQKIAYYTLKGDGVGAWAAGKGEEAARRHKLSTQT